MRRPHEDSTEIDTGELEHSIEKKRARVTMEAIHRAEVSLIPFMSMWFNL